MTEMKAAPEVKAEDQKDKEDEICIFPTALILAVGAIVTILTLI